MTRIDPETELPVHPGDQVDREIMATETPPQEDGSGPVIINGQFWFTDWGGDEEG